jgi:hypothetical protein
LLLLLHQVAAGIPFSYEEEDSYDYEFLVDAASVGIGAKALAGATAFLRNGVRAKAFIRGQATDTVSYELDRANFNTLNLNSGSDRVISSSIGAYLNTAKDDDESFFTDVEPANTFLFGH